MNTLIDLTLGSAAIIAIMLAAGLWAELEEQRYKTKVFKNRLQQTEALLMKAREEIRKQLTIRQNFFR